MKTVFLTRPVSGGLASISLIALLFGPLSFTTFAADEPAIPPTVKNVAVAPNSMECSLITSAGLVKVPAQRALYQVGPEGGGRRDVPMVALYDPGTQQSWIGFQCEIYVRTSRGIVGLAAIGNGFHSRKSLLGGASHQTAKLGDLWAAFDKEAPPVLLYEDDSIKDRIIFNLPVSFGTRFAHSSQMGVSRIDSARLANGQITIDISNQGGDAKAEIVLDEGTLQIKNAKMLE